MVCFYTVSTFPPTYLSDNMLHFITCHALLQILVWDGLCVFLFDSLLCDIVAYLALFLSWHYDWVNSASADYSESVVLNFLPNQALASGLAAKAWFGRRYNLRTTDFELGCWYLLQSGWRAPDSYEYILQIDYLTMNIYYLTLTLQELTCVYHKRS